jgi:transcriptional regulator with XRE-family HTH domain
MATVTIVPDTWSGIAGTYPPASSATSCQGERARPPARHQRRRGATSRYENGKTTPTAEVVVRLAEIFDVSTDYLLIDGAPRRPFGDTGDELTERIGMASLL